jgi:DNA-binding transcriptional ArsR family regulator
MKAPEAADIAKALSHPIRIEILTIMRRGELVSPVEFSRGGDAPLGSAAYHMRALQSIGAVEPVKQTARRGAIEHHYCPGPRFATVCRVLDALDVS